MNFTRAVGGWVLAAGIGLAGALGTGIATASADPGQPCWAPDTPACQQGGPGPDDRRGIEQGRHGGPGPVAPIGERGIDQGRQDHQPFMYNGHRVTPMPAGNGDGWGFWLFDRWIRL